MLELLLPSYRSKKKMNGVFLIFWSFTFSVFSKKMGLDPDAD
jgi:hypothetical protein